MTLLMIIYKWLAESELVEGSKKTKPYSEFQKRELVEIPDLPGFEVTR